MRSFNAWKNKEMLKPLKARCLCHDSDLAFHSKQKYILLLFEVSKKWDLLFGYLYLIFDAK